MRTPEPLRLVVLDAMRASVRTGATAGEIADYVLRRGRHGLDDIKVATFELVNSGYAEDCGPEHSVDVMFRSRFRLTTSGLELASRPRGERRFNDNERRRTAANKQPSTEGGHQMARQITFMKLTELVELYNSENPDDKRKTFTNKASAVRAIEKARTKRAGQKADVNKTEVKKARAKRAGQKADVGDRAPSKSDLIRAEFKTYSRVPLEKLLRVTGWNKHVLHSAMACLRDPSRTKRPENLLVTVYERESQTYVKTK